MKQKSILIDVMLDDHYECQVIYPLRGYPLVDGLEVIDNYLLKSIIETKRPSLRNKDYHIEFTNQKV